MATRRKPEAMEILVAKDSAVVVLDGVETQISKGVSRARAGHPIVQAAPELWEPIRVHYELETATAAPGEKRGQRRDRGANR